MVQYLPSSSHTNDNDDAVVRTEVRTEYLADLKVFWGPEICRLEYLVHLLDTGRIKDDYRPGALPSS